MPVHGVVAVSGVAIQPCWGAVDASLAAEIIAMWRSGDAIASADEATRRAGEAVCVARAADGSLVAVATAQPRRIPFLGQTMYYLRAYVAPGARGSWLPQRLLETSQRVLAEDATGPSPAAAALGIFLELENPSFARIGARAVWRRSGFVYAGRTPRGLERRIWYFPGARVVRGDAGVAGDATD